MSPVELLRSPLESHKSVRTTKFTKLISIGRPPAFYTVRRAPFSYSVLDLVTTPGGVVEAVGF